MNTADYLDALRSRFDKPSDYALRDILGLHKQELSEYRTLKKCFGRKRALIVAELLELDPAQVFADMEAQRSKSPQEKKVWERIAATFGRAAVIVFAGVLIGGVVKIPTAQGSMSIPDGIYIMRSLRRYLEALARALAGAFRGPAPNAL